jgi:hypothetical protein|tara:strand:+ start:679 stop:1161 length:483 start_codon:yes stop_codon:yes gene_type:complete
MKFLEKDLEDIIYKADKETLKERGLSITGKLYRQLYIGGYGIADLVEIRRNTDIYDDCIGQYFSITVYELKKGRIGCKALLQAIRYARGIERYLNKRFKGVNSYFHIVLIGNDIELDDFCYVESMMDNLSTYTYSYDVDGISFQHMGDYYLRNEGFGYED